MRDCLEAVLDCLELKKTELYFRVIGTSSV